MALDSGKKLGPYEILSPIGKGGMGEVYRAKDTRLDREVAVKVLPEATSRDEVALTRFAREAKAVAALSHPNILAIYDVGESDGISYVVTELLEGETLRDRLTQTRMSWRQSLEFAASIADGLAAAHDKGVVHRDLKPENVFLTNDGVVKILDFGLARLEPPTPSTDPADTPTMTIATAPGSVMGTIHYMSPEQVRGLKTDARSDIFSFGCVLYEMVAGERAFQGQTVADTMTAILREEPESLTASVRGVGPELDRLVVRCLEKKPERRFHSASDLAFALRSMLSDSGTTETPVQRRATRIGGLLGNVIVAGLILLVGFLGWREWSQVPQPTGGPIRRIAVLPLENRSGDPQQEIYADAMTEAITDALAQVSALQVIAPRAMLRLKGTDLSIPELAEKLNVDAIVDASRIQVGDRIQVRARLVEGSTERLIWSEHYERDVRDVFAMQNEIALAIADGVKVILTPTEQAMLADAPTVEPEAYGLYVEGLHLVHKSTRESCFAALSLFDRTLEIDPGFALAHSGQAEAYYALASTHFRPSEMMPQMKQAALAALALDPDLVEAHVALGLYRMQQEWDWDAAETSLKRALEINQSHSGARLAYADFLVAMKRIDEAKQHLDRVQELDPDAKFYRPDYGAIAFMSRDYPRVVRDSMAALKVNRDFWPALQWMGLAHAQLGQMTEGISDLRKAHQLSQSAQVAAMLGGVLANAGEAEEARAIRKKLKAEKDQTYVCPYEIATISIGLGEYDQAFDEMDEAGDDRAECIPWLQADPRLDPIRHLPRFDALLVRVGFEPTGRAALSLREESKKPTLLALPFEDISADPDTGYLAHEIPASIIDRLSRLSELRVIPRSTAFRYDAKTQDATSAGKRLGADFTLTGQINARGDDLRVRAQLIDVATNAERWGDRYDRRRDDIIDIENDLVERIADALRIQVTGEERAGLKQRDTINPEAYRAYLQGRFWWNRRSESGLEQAIRFFGDAVRIDPDYAAAYAGKADCYCMLAWYYRPPREMIPKAKEAIDAAIAMDPTSAEAYAAQGWVRMSYDWDWIGAERSFLRAIDLDPSYATARHWYGTFLLVMGQHEQAAVEIEKARVLDSGSPIINKNIALPMLFQGRIKDAVAQLERTRQMDPTFVPVYRDLCYALILSGRFDEAIDTIQVGHRLAGRFPLSAGLLGLAYAKSGRIDLARNELELMTERSKREYVPAIGFANVHAGLGESDEAFLWLDRACDAREGTVVLLGTARNFSPLRDDPRFDAVLRRIGLDPATRKPMSGGFRP